MPRTEDTLRKALQSTIQTKMSQAANSQRKAQAYEAAGRSSAASSARAIADNSLRTADLALQSLKKL